MLINKNEGTADRIVRAIVTIGLYAAAFFTTGTAQVFFLIFAITMTITTILGWCPLYLMFGINTCGKAKE